jgi:hypothetical protein
MRCTPMRHRPVREAHRERHSHKRYATGRPDEEPRNGAHRKQTRPYSERGTGFQRALPMQLARTYSTIGRNVANQPTTVNHIPVDCRFLFGAPNRVWRCPRLLQAVRLSKTHPPPRCFHNIVLLSHPFFSGSALWSFSPPPPGHPSRQHCPTTQPVYRTVHRAASRAISVFRCTIRALPTPQLAHALSTVFDSWFVGLPRSDLPGDG